MEVRPLTLTVLGGAAGVTCAQTFDVSKVTIGRTRGNKLVIKDSTVSSKHCQLTWREGSWQLSDLDSTNGTSINGSEKIEAGGEVALLHGQVIHLGPEIKVLAAIQDSMDDLAHLTVEQKLLADSQRAADCIAAVAQAAAADIRRDWAAKRKELEELLIAGG